MTLIAIDDLGESRIAAMDAQGIDMAIISLITPGTGTLAPTDALPFSREANDIAAEAVRNYPSRLRAFSTPPMVEPGAAAEEPLPPRRTA